jgi:hypothetical protein
MEIQFDLSQPEYVQSAHSDSRPHNPTGVAAANPLVLLAVGAALGWALSFAVGDGTSARPVDVVAASTSTLLDPAALPELAPGGSVYRSQVPVSPVTLSSDLDAYAPGGSVYRSQVAGPRPRGERSLRGTAVAPRAD